MNINFDIKKLTELMKHFYALTKIRIVIFDNEFNKIVSVPENECEFCSAVKSNEYLKKCCTECDINAKNSCRSKNSFHMYTCHAGLIEAISPLKMNDIILGYIMLGQVIERTKRKSKRDEILNYVGSYISDRSIDELYEKIKSKDKSQITAAANIMEACASYVWVNSIITVDENSLAALISAYIKNNLTENLSSDMLCLSFSLSRNKLYKLFRESFGMGVAEFVRHERIKKAKELLKKGFSVAQAAEFSGFCDYNYFSVIFKNETGMLPSRYAGKQNRREP